MKLSVVLVVYIFVQTGFEVTKARGGGGSGGGRGGGSRSGSFRGAGGSSNSRAANSGRLFTAERLSSRFIMFHGGGYVLSGHSTDECLPPLDAYKIKEFVDVMKSILRIGGTMDNGTELAEQFMTLDVDSSIQTWFDLTLKLFNVHTTQSNLNQILSIAIPRNPVDENLSKVFSVDNNNRIENALLRSSTTLENVKHLITYLRVFNTNSWKSFYSLTLPGIEVCYNKYKQIINPNNQDLLDIFPSLTLLEHSMCRSGAGGKSFIEDLGKGGSRSDNSLETLPRNIQIDNDEEYVLSGHGYLECLPPLDAYSIKEFIDVTKNILRMGRTTEDVVELAEQFMNLDPQSSIQTWFDLTLQLFNVTAMPMNLTVVLGREIPNNPLDDKLSEILSAENNDKIENALPHSANVKDLMDYLRGFDDESYFFWIDYGTDICYDKYNEIVNPSSNRLSNIFPSLVTLRDSMCRPGAEKARQRSYNIKIWGFEILIFVSLCLVVVTCLICQRRKRVTACNSSGNDV